MFPETYQQNTVALDLIIDFFFNLENRVPPIVHLPVGKICSRREVDLKWVWLVETPFENPGYGLAGQSWT